MFETSSIGTASMAWVGAAGALFVAMGCATTGDLVRLGSQDLGCEESALMVHEQNRRATVTGCGRTARYQKICEDSSWNDLASCGWIMVDAPGPQSRPIYAASLPPSEVGTPTSDTIPTEALGFSFGQDVVAARSACEGAGHAFTISKTSQATFYCSGSPKAVGVPIRESLTFCQGALCQIVALAEFHPDEEGDRKLGKVLTGLVDQYGRPDLSGTQVPKSCGPRTARCIFDGQARWNTIWRWSNKRFLHVEATPKADLIQLRLEYSLGEPEKPAPTEAVDGDVDVSAF